MSLVRHVVPALAAGLFWVVPLRAQDSTGAVTGKVLDGTTQQPVGNVEVAIAGTPHRELTHADGSFLVNRIPPGAYHLRATRIGYGSQVQDVTVTAGGTTTVQLTMLPAAAILEPVVVTGYGTRRRDADPDSRWQLDQQQQRTAVRDRRSADLQRVDRTAEHGGRWHAAAAAQPAESPQPVGHRVHHDPERRFGDRDLRQPRRERRDTGRDEEGSGGRRADHRVRRVRGRGVSGQVPGFGDRRRIPAVRTAASANFHRGYGRLPETRNIRVLEFGWGARSGTPFRAGDGEHRLVPRCDPHRRHA